MRRRSTPGSPVPPSTPLPSRTRGETLRRRQRRQDGRQKRLRGGTMRAGRGGRTTMSGTQGSHARLPLRGRGDPWLYAFARIVLVPAVLAYGRLRVTGVAYVPERG